MPKKTKAEIRKSISKPLSKNPAIKAKQIKERKALVKKAVKKKASRKRVRTVFDIADLGVLRRARGK